MYIFILESIGTAELILIGIIALIVFGPRKLPEMAKKLGKMMAEFRSATNEFKTTWQREASFEEETNQIKNLFEVDDEREEISVEEVSLNKQAEKKFTPEIRKVDPAEIKKRFDLEKDTLDKTESSKTEISKRDWL